MVLDLCGSSAMSNTDEQMAYHIHKRLDSISRSYLQKHNHDFFKSTGDGFLATFDSAADAVLAAQGILAEVDARNARSSNPPIMIRIALNYGIYFPFGFGGFAPDIHGNDVNVTFRVEGLQDENFEVLHSSIPTTNRILCTQQFVEEISDATIGGKLVVDFCGEAMLKGIQGLQKIYRLTPV